MKHFFAVFIFLLAAHPAIASENCDAGSAYQVLILPPTGGASAADRIFMNALCKRGHTTAILDYTQKSALTSDLTIHDQVSREVLKEIDAYLGESSMPTVLVGTSLGGLYASMAFGYSQSKELDYPHLKWIEGAVLVAAGGSLAEILAYSEQDAIVEQRNLRFKEKKYKSDESYLKDLERNIFFDPMKWANPKLASRILMFNSSNDRVVPTATQENLWNAWGNPELETAITNHQLTIGRFYLFRAKAVHEFLLNLESIGAL